jgi:hypothetical protein
VERWQDDRARVGADRELLAGHLLKFQVVILNQGSVLNTTRLEGEGFEKLSSEDWIEIAAVAEVAEVAEEAMESSWVEDTEMAQEDYSRVAVGPVHIRASELAGVHEVLDSHAQEEPL